MVPDGIEIAYTRIREALDAIDGLPKTKATPLAPQQSQRPAHYFSYDTEEFSQDAATADLKWIIPQSGRAVFVSRVYIDVNGADDAALQLMRVTRKVKQAVRHLTARDDVSFKCRVVRVVPTYNFEAATWAAVEIGIQVGEYLTDEDCSVA